MKNKISFELTSVCSVYIVDSSVQKIELQFWILQAVVAQVQLYHARTLGAKNWRQSFIDSLWEVTVSQPENNEQ